MRKVFLKFALVSLTAAEFAVLGMLITFLLVQASFLIAIAADLFALPLPLPLFLSAKVDLSVYSKQSPLQG